jgi:hypothetical protein
VDLIWKKIEIAMMKQYICQMNLREIGLQLCTCTWIEIMTCIGITLYLTFSSQFYLALLTVAVFSPLIGFHFAVSRLAKPEGLCAGCQGVGNYPDKGFKVT